MEEKLRIIISGGGTGGHIFPAISIANAVKEQLPETEILFVGAEDRMEMQRIPAAGYPIIGLPIAGFDRKHLLKNIAVAYKLVKSQLKARQIIKDFRPDITVGVGGYASGPTLKTANMMGIPTLLQEQNSYAGVTNKLLAKQAEKICVAYEGMERFFDKDKLILTGNPVRQDLLTNRKERTEAIRSFGLDPNKQTVLVLGGSLGARTINRCMMQGLAEIKASAVQFIWQAGKIYIDEARATLKDAGHMPMVYLTDFISDMGAAYDAADLVISRAGAGSISEFCLLSKPIILVPSPNVAEDHQTKNARTLVDRGAALYVRDADAETELINKAIETVNRPDLLKSLSENIHQLAFTDAANKIAQEVIRIAVKHKNAGR